MGRFIRQLGCTLLTGLLAGSSVGGGSATARAALEPLDLHARDGGHTFHLEPEQRVRVHLPAQSPSGYRCWVRNPAAGVLELEQEPPRLGPSQPWRFRAWRSGHARLVFECAQELGGRAPRVHAYDIRVERAGLQRVS